MIDMKITRPPRLENIEKVEIKEDYIKRFIERLESNSVYTNTFYENYKTLTITPKDKITSDVQGTYNMLTNEICIVKTKNWLSYITHELLHMSSTVRDDDKIYSGFIQGVADYKFGFGLTEGYTQYLDERYFSDFTPEKKELDQYIYPVTKKIAGWVEDLIGQDKMEEFYFTGNLRGLLCELSKLSSPQRALNFIHDFDHYWYQSEDKAFGNAFESIQLFERMLLFILECGYTKLKLRYLDNKMSTEEYIENLKGIRSLQCTRLHWGLFGVLQSKKLGDKYYYRLVENCDKKLVK